LSRQHASSATLIQAEKNMGRYLLLWFLGIPIPVLILIWAFGGQN
jgi:hypothetical protein